MFILSFIDRVIIPPMSILSFILMV
jgi:hypothetical protein